MNLHALCSLLLVYIVDAGAHCLVLPFKAKAPMQDMPYPQNVLAQFSTLLGGEPQSNGY